MIDIGIQKKSISVMNHRRKEYKSMNKMNGSIVIIKTNYRMWVDKREELRNRLLKEAEEGLIIVDIPESEVHVVKQSDIIIGIDLENKEDFTNVGNKR